MEKVKVDKIELLGKLRENRDIHEEEYNDAFAGWQGKIRDAFEESLRKIQAGDFSELAPANGLPKPQHHLKDYDLAIKMLEMSVDSNVEIEQYDFNRYVMDEWEWKAGFALTNSTYL